MFTRVTLLSLALVALAITVQAKAPQLFAKQLQPADEPRFEQSLTQDKAQLKSFIDLTTTITAQAATAAFTGKIVLGAGTTYSGFDTARTTDTNSNILYVVQKQTKITFKGAAAKDGLAIYIGETKQTFKGRYSSASQMSTGLQAVIATFTESNVQVTIYPIGDGTIKFDESVAQQFVTTLTGSVGAMSDICVGNIRGMGWKTQKNPDLQCE